MNRRPVRPVALILGLLVAPLPAELYHWPWGGRRPSIGRLRHSDDGYLWAGRPPSEGVHVDYPPSAGCMRLDPVRARTRGHDGSRFKGVPARRATWRPRNRASSAKEKRMNRSARLARCGARLTPLRTVYAVGA